MRKPTDSWAVLAVPVDQFNKRITDRGYSYRTLASAVGHESHSHIYRLAKGKVRSTSPHTADLLEALLDARGQLFAVKTARTSNRVAA